MTAQPSIHYLFVSATFIFLCVKNGGRSDGINTSATTKTGIKSACDVAVPSALARAALDIMSV